MLESKLVKRKEAGGLEELGPEEQRILLAYLNAVPKEYPTIKISVRLLPKEKKVQNELDKYLKSWNLLNAPRVDAINYTGYGTVTIFEIKPIAHFPALSQVLAYKELYRTIVDPHAVIKMVILCDSAGTQVKDYAKLLNIDIVEIRTP
jgi:hypothetical protein